MSGRIAIWFESFWLLLLLPLMTGAALLSFIYKPILFLPFALSLALTTAWLISRFKLQVPLMTSIAFFLPFSFETAVAGDFIVFIPTEPLIGIALLSVMMDVLRYPGFLKDFISRELRWSLPLLGIFLITIPFSVMPMVSVKFAIVNITYLLVFLFLLNYLFRQHPGLFPRLMVVYSTGLLIVLVFALFRYSGFDWNITVVKGIFLPFYKDHTIMGATATIVASFWLMYTGTQKKTSFKILAFLTGFLFVFAVILSGSRAAILSLGFFLSVVLLLSLRARISHLIVLSLVTATFMFIFRHQIVDTIYRNPYVSRSHYTEWTGKLKSAGNITTDVSNIERMNRWYSGVKMFAEKPLTGFGPGTYQFVYIPYQKKELMNRLTVKNHWNIPENSGGTAHSEYILALSEMGIFGFLALILVLFRLFWITFVKARFHPHRGLIVVAFAALSTYLFHALFNNFLNSDKFAFLFWGMAAWLMATYENNKDERVLYSG
ncbi:MAG: O-antigen ligase family protein [Bacteroidales bacterium]|nr:O-antigen ligase family protein [Bacteroidales bacterium]